MQGSTGYYMKKRIKYILASFWYKLQGTKMERGFRDANYKVPIVCYHSVSPQYNSGAFRITPNAFEEQISYLTHHYNVIPLSAFVDQIYKGQALKNTVIVTFDDGYRDNYIYAYPILKKYKCPATIFLPTAFIEREIVITEDKEVLIPLKWPEIREMAKSGLISIGAHGHTHIELSSLDTDGQRKEIRLSKKIIKDKVGLDVNLFAYPYGQLCHFNLGTINLLKNEGFIAACSTVWNTENSKRTLYALRRVMINSKDNIKMFKMKLSGAYNYLYYIHLCRKRLR